MFRIVGIGKKLRLVIFRQIVLGAVGLNLGFGVIIRIGKVFLEGIGLDKVLIECVWGYRGYILFGY